MNLETADPALTPEQTGALRRLASRLRRSALARNHRLTLIVTGDPQWTTSAAEAFLTGFHGETAWLSNRHRDSHRLPLAAAFKLLGSELDNLVYDAQAGFDPDGFGAAVGALRGGGLLLLLTPPLALWPARFDPQAERVAVEPFRPDQVSGRFVYRLASVLTGAPGVTLVRQGHPIPDPPGETTCVAPPADRELDECRTRDQKVAVEAVLQTARGRARRPLVITSDRGRGKSSALGIAASRLLRDGERRILVTAPRRSAVDALFRHAALLLPDARPHSNRIDHPNGGLLFLPPDRLCAGREEADMLLVDEAAGIPAPLLGRLLRRYPRVVFATTIHGYEGTGRGFEVRFRRSLETLTPGHRTIELRTPVRWAVDDPLETLVSRALLLDASPAPSADMADASAERCSHECPDRDQLAKDETTLSELFGLLVLAHYQTRPLDLRHLLDGPNVQVHLLRHEGRVAATALVALEGGFDAKLARQVYEGRRRPRGHLLPQTLAAHAGLGEAPLLRFARIVRIAVHPAAQGRGLGRNLLEKVEERARAGGADAAGASFGATPDLLDFWKRCRFVPVHLGTSRNSASGAHAAVVVRPITEAGDALANRAGTRLGHRFPGLLSGPFRDLEPDIAAALIAAGRSDPHTASQSLDWEELASFAFAQRPFEASVAAIEPFLRSYLAPALREDRLGDSETAALIARVLQYRDWKDTALLVGATGRAQVLETLRRSVRRLIRFYGPSGDQRVFQTLSPPPR